MATINMTNLFLLNKDCLWRLTDGPAVGLTSGELEKWVGDPAAPPGPEVPP